MITAEKARQNKAEFHRGVEAQLQGEALRICDEDISPLIEEASSKGAERICFRFEGCDDRIKSRVGKILEANQYSVRMENGGKCCTISW